MYGLEHLSFSEIITVTFSLFAVIDILGSVPILVGLKSKMGSISSGLATIVSGILILTFFAFGGEMLRVIGLDIPSFALAGSLIIFFLALEMVLGIEIFKHEEGMGRSAGSIVPIAFPMIAGSGTLTTVMSLKASYHSYNILISIFINLIIVYFCLRSLNLIEKALGPSGIAVIRKFFGVILVAISIKIFKENIYLMINQ